MTSAGPDLHTSRGEFYVWGQEMLEKQTPVGTNPSPCALYDATNGTVSYGDIVRVGP